MEINVGKVARMAATQAGMVKTLGLSIEEMIDCLECEQSGWGCTRFNLDDEGTIEHTFVYGDRDNSEAIDPEYGISYFRVITSPSNPWLLKEFGAAPKGVEYEKNRSTKYVFCNGQYLPLYYDPVHHHLWETKQMPFVMYRTNEHAGVPYCFSGVAEYTDSGKTEWWLDGKRHRTDGPAVEYADGTKHWFLNGELYSSFIEFSQALGASGLTDGQDGVKAKGVDSTTETGMSNIILSDGKIVARRIAVEKIAKVIQGLMVQAFTKNSKGKSKQLMQNQLQDFFATENGKAMVKFIMGCAAPFIKSHVPQKYHAVIDDVATEARVQGETTVILQAIDAIQPLISMLSSSVMQSLETLVAVDEKVRVQLDTDAPEVHHETVAVPDPMVARA